MDKIKIFEMFAGYGGASFALKKANIPFECVGFSEIDKFAIQCYQQNHRDITNYGDATKINPQELSDFDLLTGGFPCQAFSVAGKGLGELDTRGTLFNDIIRIAEVKQPKYMLLENVKGLLSKRHKETFNKILSELKRIGYSVSYQILNSKEYGIPQNRERVFFVCSLEHKPFIFPEKEELKLFLKDILEENVDEKYYLSETQRNKLLKNQNKGHSLSEKGQDIIQVNMPSHSNNRVYSEEGISPTLNTMQGGQRQPFIQVKNATLKGYMEAKDGDGLSLEHPNSKTRRGRVQDQMSPTLQCNDSKGVVTCQAVITPDRINKRQNGRRFKTDGEPSFTLNTQDRHGVLLNGLTIRKLTPTECFRLMGFLDDNINLEGLSNSQRYKLAGNGWDINLVSKIFKKFSLQTIEE